MTTPPKWFKDSPEWFQSFYVNDFSHVARDTSWLKKLVLIILAAVVGGYFVGGL